MQSDEQRKAFEYDQAREQIEGVIDRFGLRVVTDMLAGICQDKAEHVESNWQDRKLARQWERNSKAFSTIRLHATE